MKIIYLILIISIISCTKKETHKSENMPENNFIYIKDHQFIKNGQPYQYIGTNLWYGALLGMENGNRERLIRELDFLNSQGINNLRILVGAEGGTDDYTVRTPLQPKQGEFNDDVLVGLDFLLDEMAKRDMDAVLYLTNNWEWSGGLAKYLEWNGYGEFPNPNLKDKFTWPQFFEYTGKFHACEPCRKAFLEQVKHVVTRTNSINGKKYTDDKAIMAWQVANEPRVFTVENEKKFTSWVNEVVDLINSLDSNHLISTGSEGKASSNDDLATFYRTHQNPNIDYLTMHIWSKNWGWYDVKDEKNTLELSKKNALKYLNEHDSIAKKLNKPIVLEEFGFPRNGESTDKNSSVSNRDAYYNFIFEQLMKSVKSNNYFQGINFWGFGGFANNNPAQPKWNIGDDYTTDPPMEPQGFNSVFVSDNSTLLMIKSYNDTLQHKIK